MPPNVALIICIIFVLFLLRFDKKQSPNVTFIIWIPTVWILLISSKPLGVWFPDYAGSSDVGSFLDRNFLTVLLVVGILILFLKKVDIVNFKKNNQSLLILFSYMFVSIFWSDIIFVSFKRYIREIVAIVMALLILTQVNPREATYSIIRRSIYIMIPFSLLLIKYFPEYGRQYGRWTGEIMWIGVATQKNGLGRLCLIAIFFLTWSFVRRWQGRDTSKVKYQVTADFLVLLIAFWLLKGSEDAYSATSIAVLTLSLVIYFILLKRKKYHSNLSTMSLVGGLFIMIILGILTMLLGGTTVQAFVSTLGRDATLTGRTDIWANLLLEAKNHPILGSGFGGFWTDKAREIYHINEAHNGYLDVLLQLGVIGLFLSSMFLLSSCKRAQSELIIDFDWASLWICFLFMTVFHNFTESSISSFSTQLTAIILFFAVVSTIRK